MAMLRWKEVLVVMCVVELGADPLWTRARFLWGATSSVEEIPSLKACWTASPQTAAPSAFAQFLPPQLLFRMYMS